MGSHFGDKKVEDHIKSTFVKGRILSEEIHGLALPQFYFHFFSASRTFAILGFILFLQRDIYLAMSLVFSIGVALALQVIIAAYAKLERLNNILEQERWEIENNREQEREELRALYASRGVSGKMLDDLVTILMADQSRVLEVMLQEELGLTLHSQDHPIIQGIGFFLGALLTSVVLFFTKLYLGFPYMIAVALATIISISILSAKRESIDVLKNAVWQVAIFIFLATLFYLLGEDMDLFSLSI